MINTTRLRNIASEEGIDNSEKFVDFVNATLISRADLVRNLVDPRRDIDSECGFPRDITAEALQYIYDREPLATKVVDIYPNHCWKVAPIIFDVGQTGSESQFEIALKRLQKNLRGDSSHYKGNKGSILWNKCKKVDRLSGINTYGILVIGFNDGKPLREPVEPRDGMKVTFLSAYSQSSLKIIQSEADERSARFDMPVMYEITTGFDEQNDSNLHSQAGDTENVHFSRVIHVSEDTGEGDLFHTPRMQPVYNLLHGARKLYGGSPEGYWKMAFTTLLIEAHPGVSNDDINHDAVNAQINSWQNGLQKVLKLVGLSGKAVSPTVINPQPFIEPIIDAICIHLEVPKRIFLGSERGELASSQDTIHWNESVADKQNGHITPNIIVPLLDRLISLKVLPEPQENGYEVKWPDLTQPTREQQVEIADKITDSMVKFVQGGIGDNLMTKTDYLVEILGLEEDAAQKVVDNFEEEIPEPDGRDELDFESIEDVKETSRKSEKEKEKS